jgi:ATP-dependent metalloprotease
MGVERKTAVRSQEALKRTAYHESGHALVALHTPGASPIHKATIVPRGHALGMVTQVRVAPAIRLCREEQGRQLCSVSGRPLHAQQTNPLAPCHSTTRQVGREDEFSINRQQMMARILVCMGGQVAEEIVFGKDQVRRSVD